METIHKAELKARMNKDNKSWVAVVKNVGEGKGIEFEVVTNFFSDKDTFENVLHKVELDLMTNLHNGIREPIELRIGEVKKR